MLYQGASLSIINNHVGPDNSELLRGLAAKVARTCRDIQACSDFVTRQQDEKIGEVLNNLDLAAPSNTKFWELVQALGDQLYTLVEQKKFCYAEMVDMFYSLTQDDPLLKSSYSFGILKTPLPKDNTLLWLILQLLYLEHFKEDIHVDFTTSEAVFHKLAGLYNCIQTESVDAYHLRDLALQCALVLHQESITDRNSLKLRLPELIPALKYSQVTYLLHNQFIQTQERLSSRQFFDPPELGDRLKLGIVGQLRQGPYVQALFINLLPPSHVYGKVAYPSCTFIQGGVVHYQVLDQLPVEAKAVLLQLIFSVSLNGQKGPQAPSKDLPTPACVSPSIVDTVYRLIYSAPLVSEPIVVSNLEKLRLSEVEATDPGQTPSEVSLRWKASLLQLLNYRLLRYLKNSNLDCLLIPCITKSITKSLVDQTHPQLYLETECFAANVILIQSSLQNLVAGTQFKSSHYLSLLAVLKVIRLSQTRGIGTLSKETLSTFLQPFSVNIPNQTLAFSSTHIKEHFQVPSLNSSAQDTFSQTQTILNQWGQAHSSLFEGEPDLQQLLPIYLVSHQLLLPMAWAVIMAKRFISNPLLKLLHQVLTQVGPAGQFERTCRLLDVILLHPSINEAGPILDCLIWKHHILSFHHILFALCCYHPPGQTLDKRWFLINYLLFQSNEFKNRYDFWVGLFGTSVRVWLDNDHFTKHFQFLQKFPEPFQLEWCNTDSFDIYSHQSNNTLPHLPSYFGNTVLRVLQPIEYMFGSWIEFEQINLLELFLESYPKLITFHQFPITIIYSVLRHYSNSKCFTKSLQKRWVAQLDFTQLSFSKLFYQYLTESSGNTSFLCYDYFASLIKQLSSDIDPTMIDLGRPDQQNTPERHFREIPNPAVFSLTVASIEILAIPHDAAAVSEFLINLILDQKNLMSSFTIKEIQALGLLLSQLPFNYIHPVLDTTFQKVISDSKLPYEWIGPYSHQTKYGLKTPLNSLIALYHSVLHYSCIDYIGYIANLLQKIETPLSTHQLDTMFSLSGPSLLRLINVQLFDELFASLVSLILKVLTFNSEATIETPITLLCLARRQHSLDLPLLHEVLGPFLINPNGISSKYLAQLFSLL